MNRTRSWHLCLCHVKASVDGKDQGRKRSSSSNYSRFIGMLKRKISLSGVLNSIGLKLQLDGTRSLPDPWLRLASILTVGKERSTVTSFSVQISYSLYIPYKQ